MMYPETVRKLVIMLGLSFSSISEGFIFGHLSGMTGELLLKDSDVHLSANEVSWIASAIMITGVLGYMVSAVISERFGRRHTIIMLTLPIILHWITLYYAKSFIVLMIAKTIVGICFGGVMSIILISTAEYNDSKHRASCLSLITSMGPSIGGTLGTILCTLLHWRVVALVGIIPSAISAIIPFFWVESPPWLASKGQFEECEVAFKALHGSGPVALAELQLLITVEKQKQRQLPKGSNSQVSVNKKLFIAIKQKYFWKLALMSTVIIAFEVAIGKVQISVYVMPIFQGTIGRADFLIINLFTSSVILGCCLAPFISSKLRMRPLLMSSGILGNICLTVLSVCIYINSESVYVPWINGFMIMFYVIIMNAGTFPVTQALKAEIYPLDIKCYCLFIFGIEGAVCMFLSVKLAPSMFITIGYHGVFMLNVTIMSLCLVYFWFCVPETKGITLQEIELHFKNENCNEILLEEKSTEQEF